MKVNHQTAVESCASQFLIDANVPGFSLSLVEKDRIVFSHAAGFTDLASRDFVRPHTLFQVGCLGKPVTAVGLLILHEKGRFQLDDSIAKYLPSSFLPRAFDKANPITIRHLLSHSSGLPRGSFSPVKRSSEEYRAEIAESVSVFQPGSRFKISNLGYFLCGCIVEQVTGEKFENWICQQVFRPLGMMSATYSPDPKSPVTTAVGHSRGEYYSLVRKQDVLMPSPNFPLPSAVGGFFCTAEDYTRFLLSVIGEGPRTGGELVNARMRQELRTVWTRREGEKSGTGLGFHIRSVHGATLMHHSGSNSGFSALVLADPENQRGAVAFSNRSNAYYELRNLVSSASSLFEDGRGGELVPLPTRHLESFSGRYFGECGPLDLSCTAEGLIGLMNGQRFVLRRRGSLTFLPESGPFGEHIVRFSAVRGEIVSCSAGSFFFDRTPLGGPPRLPSCKEAREIAGRYLYPRFATCELFWRRDNLYLQCGPLDESKLSPEGRGSFRQNGGYFDGELVQLMQSENSETVGLRTGGMTFLRT